MRTEEGPESIVLRGISGSGKSTYAKKLKERLQLVRKVEICSADDFFMKEDKYVFDWRLLGRAHAACLKRFVYLLQNSDATIVVDNTNTTVIEIAPYMALAQAYDRPARVITLDAQPEEAVKRNVHGVLIDSIFKQQHKLYKEEEIFPHFWKHTREKT